MKKVWVVFTGVDDYYGPYFHAVCESKEAAELLIKERSEATISEWTWLKPERVPGAIEEQITGYDIEEHDVVGIVGLRKSNPLFLNDLRPH